MGWFRKTPKTPEELAQVRLEIEQLRAAMEQHDTRLGAQPDLPELVGRLDALDLAVAGSRDGELSARFDAMVEQLSTLDSRVTAVSKELANQISELGNDIDALQKRAKDEPVADEVIEAVLDAQERLASEQARYQIAFREDLARLAEQLRRPRG